MRSLLGLDIGTQGTKGLLVSEQGEQLSTAFRPSQLHRPGPGMVEEDPEQQLTAACEVIEECLGESNADPASVAAVGVAGQMAGVIGIGRDGRHVTPYDSWLDTRCGPYIVRMDEEAGEAIVRSAGCPPSFNHGPKMLWWRHERPEVFKEIRAFVQPGGYVAMRLCGLSAADAFIDHTYLHFSGFADNARAQWNTGLCEQFGLDPILLPHIVEPHRIIGKITASMAAQCSLKAGTPVVAGCGDTAASFLACGATAEGICVDVAGTASVFAATTSRYRPDVDRRILACGRSATPGLWHSYAYINGGGMNLEWFLREIANRGRLEAEDALQYEDLERMAAKATANEDAPLFLPHLEGRVCPSDPNLRGAWVGLTRGTSLGALYRAVLESVALEYGIYQRATGALYPELEFRELRITGGGERSTFWNQLKADVLKMAVVQVQGGGGAPLGAAMLAGLGVGLHEDLPSAAAQWIVTGQRVRHNAALSEYYGKRVDRYEAALRAMGELHN